MKNKILIIEDEKKLSDIMALYLNKEGFETECFYNGYDGENAIEQNSYNLIILDIMIPGKDGWSLLRKIKTLGNTPVILTTARGDEEDRIFGLELGADDYMVKPISMRELILRINLRIKDRKTSNATLIYENMSINEEQHLVKENNKAVILTPKEYDLLIFLCKNPVQVFKREQLLDKVWGFDFTGESRTVDVHIRNLRDKLQFCEDHLKTVWGVGYRLEV